MRSASAGDSTRPTASRRIGKAPVPFSGTGRGAASSWGATTTVVSSRKIGATSGSSIGAISGSATTNGGSSTNSGDLNQPVMPSSLKVLAHNPTKTRKTISTPVSMRPRYFGLPPTWGFLRAPYTVSLLASSGDFDLRDLRSGAAIAGAAGIGSDASSAPSSIGAASLGAFTSGVGSISGAAPGKVGAPVRRVPNSGTSSDTTFSVSTTSGSDCSSARRSLSTASVSPVSGSAVVRVSSDTSGSTCKAALPSITRKSGPLRSRPFASPNRISVRKVKGSGTATKPTGSNPLSLAKFSASARVSLATAAIYVRPPVRSKSISRSSTSYGVAPVNAALTSSSDVCAVSMVINLI